MTVLEFYDMNEEPFSNAPVHRFYYNSEPHSKALVRLMYAIDAMKGLAVLIGEIGSGKTTLARRLLDSLPEEEYEAALLVIIHAGVDALWLLKRIAMQFGVDEPSDDKLALMSQIYRRLVEIHESGKKPVVLIDEAQMLCSREIMEEFRGLLNLEMPEKKLLNIVLIGLPDLEDCLALDPPLQQRIAVKYHLGALDSETTESYIKHRLRLAGAKRMLFTKEATEAIYDVSRGIPRLINTICDNALFEGHILKAALIDTPLIRNVCMDLGMMQPRRSSTFRGTRAGDFDTPTEHIDPRSGRAERRQPAPPRATQSAAPPPAARNRRPAPPVEDDLDGPAMDEIDGILDSLVDKI